MAGFGERQVHLADTKAKAALHPVWSVQTHFKVLLTQHPTGSVKSNGSWPEGLININTTQNLAVLAKIPFKRI